MNASRIWVSVCVLVGLLAGTAGAVNIATVPVGNPGNAGELSGEAAGGGYGPNRICGAVAYEYRIGNYEVTAGQYTEFLNAVAKTDTYGLYNTSMWSGGYGYGCKIERYEGSGSQTDPYKYRVADEWANRPVNYVSWYDTLRFANWMQNSQPNGPQGPGTTEEGTYTFSGPTTVTLPDHSTMTTPHWVLPTEDEWYKAAYYKGGSTNAGYWDYPTSSDSLPNNVLGNPTDPGNNATYDNNGYTIGSPYYRTEVGAHENSESPYGTFDQGGNVWEWNEAVVGSDRGFRGGSFSFSYDGMLGSFRLMVDPTHEDYDGGFRVAEVPDPATAWLFLLGGFLVARRRRALR